MMNAAALNGHGQLPGCFGSRLFSSSRMLAIYFAPAGLAAAPLPPAFASSVCARLIEMFMLNSLMRLPDLSGEGTALISTSSGFSRYGEAPRLRIHVETRAFDCA